MQGLCWNSQFRFQRLPVEARTSPCHCRFRFWAPIRRQVIDYKCWCWFLNSRKHSFFPCDYCARISNFIITYWPVCVRLLCDSHSISLMTERMYVLWCLADTTVDVWIILYSQVKVDDLDGLYWIFAFSLRLVVPYLLWYESGIWLFGRGKELIHHLFYFIID